MFDLYRFCYVVHTLDVPGKIRLDVGGKPCLYSTTVPSTSCPGYIVLDNPETGFDGGK